MKRLSSRPSPDPRSATVTVSGHETAPEPFRGGPVRRFCVAALASAGGAGYAPVAPGTFGSAVGVVLYAALVWSGARPLELLWVALTASWAGVWAAEQGERLWARRDDGRIVIDEVAGQLFALFPLVLLLPAENWLAPAPLLAGFLIFRALDIWKPGPVRWAERNLPGGEGVMFDDVLAGIFSGLLLAMLLLLLGQLG